MKMVVHKCPNCKANLNIKDGSTSGVCDFCRAPYSIDDGVIHIEHTVEITDNTSLKVANTTLYKFKEYDEAEMLFRKLLFNYGHKPEAYIGLILSITHDFTEEVLTIPAMNEINELWDRFEAIGKDKDINKYKETYHKYNAVFWNNLLLEYTGNLKNYKTSKSLKVIEFVFNNYIEFCSKEEKVSIKNKYAKFKKQKEEYDKKRKNIFIFSIVFVISSIIVSFLINYITLINEKIIFNSDSINVSEYIKYCDFDKCNSYEFIFTNIEKINSTLNINNFNVDNENLNVSFDIQLKNKYKEITEYKTLSLVDDHGPIITDNKCSFTDTDNIYLYNCFSIYDYNDKEINSNNAKIETNNIDFKTVGEKIITVSVNDSDNNITTDNIIVNVVKSNINLNLKTNGNYLEINKTDTLNYTFSHDVPNKNVSYTYSKEFINFDETSRTIKGIKVGKAEICVIPEYDESKKSCKEIRVTALCKDSYTFKFDGSSTTKLIAGNDFCPGKYKITTTVLNKNSVYHMTLRDSSNKIMDTFTVWKSTSLGDDGKKYSFSIDGSIEVNSGITSVKLVKVK